MPSKLLIYSWLNSCFKISSKTARPSVHGSTERKTKILIPWDFLVFDFKKAWTTFFKQILILMMVFWNVSAHAQPTLAEAEALFVVGQYQQLDEQLRVADQLPDDLRLMQGELFITLGRLNAAQSVFNALAETSENLQARYWLGWLEFRKGHTEQAMTAMDALMESGRAQSEQLNPAGWTVLGHAATLLGRHDPQWFPIAVDYYSVALERDPNVLAARLALGNLLLEKYNNQEAQEVFQEALQRDPLSAQALLGLARSQHFDHSPEAQETVERALEINPNLVEARVFLAQLLLESEQYAEAIEQTLRALETNPNSLEARTLQAAAYLLNDEQAKFQAERARVFKLNPNYAEFYNELAEITARNRLYREAYEFAQNAVELDPKSWRGHGLLGLNQMRLGHIEQGVDSLERAFAGDPYNVWIKNTLDLADTFPEYELTQFGPFEIMLHRDESDLLRPYLQPLVEQAYAYYSERYGFQVEAPIRIELYPRSADFSVRTAGVAGIGLLGVSFGPVIGMDSPAARTVGSFNWGSTLWHELAHTFHLALSKNRVPRWFSEGLAVYEERAARPGWGSDPTPSFLSAYRTGRLPPVSQLNSAFVRPSYPEQIVHAYYLSSLVFDYLESIDQIGHVPAMLQAYAQGQSTEDIFRSVLSTDEADFDLGFDDYLRERFAIPLASIGALGRIMEQPGTLEDLILRAEWQPQRYELQLQAGRQLLQEGDPERAEIFLLRAQALFPEHAGDDSAYWWLTQLYKDQERWLDAIDQLRAMIAINGENFVAHLELADLLQQQGQFIEAVEALEKAMYISPYAIQTHRQLAELHALLGHWDASVRERKAVLTLQPTDLSEARYQLAHAYYRAGRPAQARRMVLQALEQAPHFAQAQDLLLDIRANTPPVAD